MKRKQNTDHGMPKLRQLPPIKVPTGLPSSTCPREQWRDTRDPNFGGGYYGKIMRTATRDSLADWRSIRVM